MDTTCFEMAFAPAFLLQTPVRPLLEYFTFERVLAVAAVVLASWLLIRFSSRLLNLLGSHSSRARFLAKWIEPVLRIGLWFLAIFISFDILAPTRETFFAAVGSAAIAIGLGAQDLIKNLVGGLVVLADRPYQLGDRVRIGDAYGEVDHIGLRSTKLTTPDDTRVTIPNSNILTDRIFNANSGVPDCQVVTDLVLPNDTDAAEAEAVGYEAALTSPYTYLAKPVVVLVSQRMGRLPYLEVRIKAYVFDHRYEARMMSDVTARAHSEFRARGWIRL